MASINWEDIYVTYTAEELDEEIAFLKAESKSIYISQSQGSKSFSRSLSDLSMRLTAATRVKSQRGGGGFGPGTLGGVDKVVVDFS